MPEPGGRPGPADIARRWATRLADTSGGGGLPTADLERALLSVAEEASDHARRARDSAIERFACLYAALPCGVVLAGPDGVVLDANPAFTELLGLGAEDLTGRRLSELGAGGRDTEILETLLHGLEPGSRPRRREQVALGRGDDGPVLTNVTMTALPGDRTDAAYPVLIAEDTTELNLVREALRKQNVQDPLTGLPNTKSFVAKLEACLATPGDDRIALIYLDIDGFKVVNDGLGPGAGDQVLCHVARKLEAVFAEDDAFVARLSGDGFAVLMRGRIDTGRVIDLVEYAMSELAEPVYIDDRGVGVSVSVGIVVRDAGGYSQEELHRAAEITLHRAKEAGRAQWMMFEDELDSHDRRRYAIGAAIGGGLENGQFDVEYQPTVKLDGSGEIAVVNAVLRWDHPEHGRLEDHEFYPLADTTGMTPGLGRWLLTKSMSDAAAWYHEFPAAPDLCVKLPTRLAIDPNLVGTIRDELERTGLPPRKLRICTDSRTLFDPRGEVPETLSVLADLDVKITLAISGASDLELVPAHKLPVGFAILSGPLVEALAGDGPDADNARGQLCALLERARELGINRVGAEGVRDAEHADRLCRTGIIAGRGRLYGGSASAEEIRSLIGPSR